VTRPEFSIEVTPGNCRIAKGASVTIRAKIHGFKPRHVELFYRPERGEAWQILPMEAAISEYRYGLSHVTEAASYYVKADDDSSPVFRIRLFEPLALKRAVWNLQFPDYLKLPAQSVQGWRDKLTMQSGTRVRLTLVFNRGIRSGALVLEGGDSIALTRLGSRKLTGEFTVQRDAVVRLQIQSSSGEPLLGLAPLWIQTLPDLAPYVEVLEPQPHGYVFPTEEIPFEINVNDDYAIRSVTLVVRYRGREQRIEWLPPGITPDTVSLKPVLDLERFRLHSRDVVFAHLEVRDTFPGGDNHLVKSPLFTFLIRDYIEQFKISSKPPTQPSLRELFEDVLVEQEKIFRDTWDMISLPPRDLPRGWEARPAVAQAPAQEGRPEVRS
jgi:hypothetical protein